MVGLFETAVVVPIQILGEWLHEQQGYVKHNCSKNLNTIILSVADIQESILVSGDPMGELQFSLSTAPSTK